MPWGVVWGAATGYETQSRKHEARNAKRRSETTIHRNVHVCHVSSARVCYAGAEAKRARQALWPICCVPEFAPHACSTMQCLDGAAAFLTRLRRLDRQIQCILHCARAASCLNPERMYQPLACAPPTTRVTRPGSSLRPQLVEGSAARALKRAWVAPYQRLRGAVRHSAFSQRCGRRCPKSCGTGVRQQCSRVERAIG